MIRLLRKIKKLEEAIIPDDNTYVIWINGDGKPAEYFVMVENEMMKKIANFPKLRGEVNFTCSLHNGNSPKNVID